MKTKLKTMLVLSLLLLTCPLPADDQTGNPGEQVELTFKTTDDAEVGYLLYLPKDYQADGDKSYPMILFLHGRGESNGPLSLVAKWGPPMMAARGDDLPYIIVSPQCPRSDFWSTDKQQARLTELLDNVVSSYNVDEQKLYLTGLSMGGYGSWTMAARYPERFAAVAPVCGGGKPEDAEKLKHLPIWVFHGDQDRAVPFQKSVEMVDAIKAAGGESIRFTSLEHIGHNCWSATYATPELYQWMDRQSSKKAETKEKTTEAKVDVSGTWKWTRDFNGSEIKFTLKVEQDGSKVTGIYKTDFDGGGPPGLSDPVDISDGQLEGDEFSFTVTREFNENELTVYYSGVIAGDELVGVTEMDFGGEAREFEWEAKRENEE